MGPMTTTTNTTTSDAVRPARPAGIDPVRRILIIDAGFCVVAGTALLASAALIADKVGLEAPTVVRAIGAFLVVLGAGLAALSRMPQRWARNGAAVTGVGDVTWAVGSFVLAVTARLPAWAAGAVLVQAAFTLGVAMAKRAALRSADE